MQCISFRRFGDTLPYGIVTSPESAADPELVRLCFEFCRCHLLGFETNASSVTPHQRYNVDVMLKLLDITPWHETIFFDSDVLRVSRCNPWDARLGFTQYRSQSINLFGRHKDCGWHFGFACKLEQRNHMRFSHTHAGMMYIRKDAKAREFFLYAQNASDHYDSLGFRPFKGKHNAHALEIHWSYAFGKLDWFPIEFDQQSLFSFNWFPNEPLPPRYLKVKNLREPKVIPQDELGYCHVHMFYDNYHASLFKKLMMPSVVPTSLPTVSNRPVDRPT